MNKEHNLQIYWTRMEFEGWRLYLAATSQGLCFVGSNGKPYEELAEWAAARFPGAELVQDDVRLQSYIEELKRYLRGEKDCFNLPCHLQGTPFQQAVWDALRQIPYGQTWSYSDIAEHINKPNAVRAVGAAIGANPVLITVPCHRVIGKSGALTGYRGGLDMKTKLLELEKRQIIG